MGYSDSNYFDFLLKQFEQLLQGKHNVYFNSDDFVDIFYHFFTTEQIELAEKAIKIALQYYPNDIELLALYAKLLHEKGNTKKAIALLEQLNEKNFDNIELSFQLAEILIENKNYEKALNLLEELYPKSEDEDDKKYILHEIIDITRILGKHISTIKYIHELLKFEKNNHFLLETLCFLYIHSNKVIQGIQFFESYTENHPLNASAWFLLGLLYSQIQNNKFITLSNEAFENALSINPQHHDATIHLAKNYLNQSDPHKSLQIISDLEYSTDYENSINEIYGKAYLSLGNYEKAIEYFENLLHQTKDYKYYVYLSQAYYNKSEIELAYLYILNYFNKSKIEEQFETITSEAYFHKSIIELELDKIDDAKNSFDKAIEKTNNIDTLLIKFTSKMLELYADDNNIVDLAIQLLETGFSKIPSASIAYHIAAILFTHSKSVKGEKWLYLAFNLDKNGIDNFLKYNPNLINNPEVNKIINLNINPYII